MVKRSGIANLALAALMLAMSGCPAGGKDTGTGTMGDPIFMRVKDQVFLIGGNEAGIMGTAFLLRYNNDTYLVSNYHVIEEIKRDDLFIESESGVRYNNVTVLGTDRAADISVMKVEGLPQTLKPLEGTIQYTTSQRIYVIGYPAMRSEEEHLNFNDGSVSDAKYLSKVYEGSGKMNYIQVTADINSGNSGSPVVNNRSQVVGVAAWRFLSQSEISGGNYAVPFSYVKELIDEIEAQPAPAEQIYEVGEACGTDGQCEWMYQCVSGTCQYLHDQGMPCEVDTDCYLPYICEATPSGMKVCTKKNDEGDYCTQDDQCMPGLWCILNACREPGDIGDPCTSFVHCKAPHACIDNVCTECMVGGVSDECGSPCCDDSNCTGGLYCIMGQCRPLGGDGDPCALGMDCNSQNCQNGVCVGGGPPQPCPGGKGEPCSYHSDCKSSLKCIGGQCTTPSKVGGPCTYDDDCQSGLICKSGGKCGAPGGVGAACKSFMECQSGLACQNGKCSPCSITGTSSTLGDPCCDDNNCAPPLYCILGQCLPMGGNGCPCGVSQDCDSNVCQNGVCVGGGPCWKNLAKEGETCATAADCVAPLDCVAGKCKGLAKQGEPCVKETNCESGLFCIDGKCMPEGGAGAKCESFFHCTPPLSCLDGTCQQCNITTTSSVIGTSCCDDSNCTGGLYCIMGTCRPLSNYNEPCGVNQDCVDYNCVNGVCKPPWDTAAAPPATSCSTDKDCSAGWYCIMDECQMTKLAPGESCEEDADCKGVCKKGECRGGESCTVNDDCTAKGFPFCRLGFCMQCTENKHCKKKKGKFKYCIMGVCEKSPHGLHEPCERMTDCGTDDEGVGLFCIMNRCDYLRDEGGECRKNEDCKQGLICQDQECTK
jgi:hypothetical protein